MNLLKSLLGTGDSQATEASNNGSASEVRIEGTDLVVLAFLREAGWEITGHQRMQKLVFLLDDHLGDTADLYSYRKYDYGPYASALKNDLAMLDSEGLIRVVKKPTFGGSVRYVYRLTGRGDETLTAATEQIDNVPELVDEVESVYDEYGEVPISNLIDDIRDSHPEYWENSVYPR